MTRLSGNNSNNMVLLIGTLVAALLIGLALFAVNKKPKTAASGGTVNFDYGRLPFSGKADAPVNVLVVEDFKCPICKNFEENITPQLKTNYVENGKAKLYSLVWPFLSKVQGLDVDDSKFAAQAGQCVFEGSGNDAFDSFKSFLFRAQGDERTAWASKDRLKEIASNVEGLDQAKFATCLDTDATAAYADENTRIANAAGVNGTPTVFVNGKIVDNPTYENISKAIDEAAK